MVQMSMKDMEVFLSEPRNATFATVSPNQSPQLTTVWFLYEQKIFYFGIERSSVKHKNIKKNSNVAACIDGDFPDGRTRWCHSFDRIWTFHGQLEALIGRYTPAVCGGLATGIRELSGFPAVSAGQYQHDLGAVPGHFLLRIRPSPVRANHWSRVYRAISIPVVASTDSSFASATIAAGICSRGDAGPIGLVHGAKRSC